MKHPNTSSLLCMGTMAALAFLAAAPLANASTPTWDKIWTPNSVSACKRLPLSEWGICKVEVVARERAAIAGAQPKYPASYGAAIAACARLPRSEQGICEASAPMHGAPRPIAAANAQGAQAIASAQGPSNSWTASNAAESKYRSALRACHALPRSEHTTCQSDAELLPHSVG